MAEQGFPRQRLAVVPRPLADEAGARPVTRTLQVTDAGWFPHARGHQRTRSAGAPESIVLICTEGAGWLDAGGARQRIGAPGYAVIPAGTPHAYGADASDPWTIWWLHLRGPLAAELLGELAQPVGRLTALGRIVELAEQITTTLERDPSRSNLVRASGLAGHLLSLLATQQPGGEGADPLQRAMAHLAENLDRPVDTAELCRHALVSASHLGALFRSETGGGPLAYHSTLRMARARQLLDGTDLPVAAVAAATGYADPLYFSRQFRRTHGLSPSAYRAEHKG